MATELHNLSDYNAETLPQPKQLKKQKYAIVVADWNDNVTFPLCQGAIDTLIKHGVQEKNVDVFHVPGAFELIYAATKLQNKAKYDAIIVIGCVIQGDTPHFDYVCGGVTQGIAELNTNRITSDLSSTCPVIFSVLTTNTLQQSLDRCGGIHGNKGVEGAITAIKMANLFV